DIITRTPNNTLLPYTTLFRSEVDVKGLEIGDTLTVADITLPEGVEIMMENDATIVSISIPTEEAEDVDPDAEAAEPEVIGATERSEEHTSELQSHFDLVCRLL